MASQLVASQSALGWDSRLISLTHTNLRDNPLCLPSHTLLAGFDNYVTKSSGFEGLVSLTRDLITTRLRDHLRDVDVVHLHWINGLTNLREVATAAPNARIVWTLHDMNPFTGACHQAFGCQGFKANCSKCPAVKRFAAGSVMRSLTHKTISYREARNLAVVSPSRWLQTLAQESQAMGELEISFIPNPVGDVFVSNEDHLPSASPTQQSPTAPAFCIVSTDLDDPLKNVGFAVEAFSAFRDTCSRARLMLVGRNGARFAGLDGVELLGELDAVAIKNVLTESCALLLPSLAENAPLVVAEAACAGTPTIGLATPALEEITIALGLGYVAVTQDDMAGQMGLCAKASETAGGIRHRQRLSTRAHQFFGPMNVAAKYLKIYEGGA